MTLHGTPLRHVRFHHIRGAWFSWLIHFCSGWPDRPGVHMHASSPPWFPCLCHWIALLQSVLLHVSAPALLVPFHLSFELLTWPQTHQCAWVVLTICWVRLTLIGRLSMSSCVLSCSSKRCRCVDSSSLWNTTPSLTCSCDSHSYCVSSQRPPVVWSLQKNHCSVDPVTRHQSESCHEVQSGGTANGTLSALLQVLRSPTSQTHHEHPQQLFCSLHIWWAPRWRLAPHFPRSTLSGPWVHRDTLVCTTSTLSRRMRWFLQTPRVSTAVVRLSRLQTKEIRL